MHKLTLAQLSLMEATQIKDEDLANVCKQSGQLRMRLEAAAATLKTLESDIRKRAGVRLIPAGADSVVTEYGTFKKTEETQLKLPKEGLDPVYQYVADLIKAGTPATEAMFLLSHSRPRKDAFADMADADLPAGLTWVKFDTFKFNATKG